MANEKEMLEELARLMQPQYPPEARTATELAEAIGVDRYSMAHRLSRLVEEGSWQRARNGKRYVYWKL